MDCASFSDCSAKSFAFSGSFFANDKARLFNVFTLPESSFEIFRAASSESILCWAAQFQESKMKIMQERKRGLFISENNLGCQDFFSFSLLNFLSMYFSFGKSASCILFA